jgi:hypothetical protein
MSARRASALCAHGSKEQDSASFGEGEPTLDVSWLHQWQVDGD